MLEYKGYGIVGDGTFGYKEIKVIGKGSVHLELRDQKFTNSKQAELAIDSFLAKQPKKATKKETKKDGIESKND